MAVLDPIKVTITNYDKEEELLDASYYPHDVPLTGSRKVPFSKEIYIEREDFSLNPPKGYYRLTPEQPVRLKHAYIISCEEVITNENGDVIEIKAKYYPNSKSGEDKSGIKVKSAIQWVSAKHAKKIEVRLYDRLYKTELPKGIEDLNENSLKVIKNALIEPAVIEQEPNKRYQFERIGYFYADPIDYSKEHPVFNQIVSLKDSWAKKSKKEAPKKEPKEIKKQKPQNPNEGEIAPMSKEEEEKFNFYLNEYGLNKQLANILARDEFLANFFKEAITIYNNPKTIANFVANEVAKEIKQNGKEALKITPKFVAKLSKLLDAQEISSKIAKEVLEECAKSGKNPVEIIEERDLKQISNPDELLPIIKEVISKNPENLSKYKAGNSKLFGFFVGQVLKATNGKANPQIVNELLKKELDS